jgi:glycosyltransferase involved in cell wall biosynthesis
MGKIKNLNTNTTKSEFIEINPDRAKVCLVVTSLLIVKFFLMPHLAALSRKYDVILIVNVDDQEFLNGLQIPITVISVNIVRKIDLWQDMKALWQLICIFRNQHFQLVHSISPKGGLLGMIAAGIAGIKIRIHTFQGEVWANRQGWLWVVLKFMDKLVARIATQLTVVSHSERQFLIDEGVISSEKSIVLANGSICGVDVDRFHPNSATRLDVRREIGINEDSIVILFLGRINRDKGVLDLAKSFTAIAAIIPSAILLFVGPDEEQIFEDIQRICVNYRERIKRVDFTPYPQRYLLASDILCLPSYREGFGLVIIEAAATGIPAIGSRIYGITDAVEDGKTGLLFTAGDVDELTQALLKLIQNPQLRQQLGKAARARVIKLFPSHKIIEEMLALYDKLLSKYQNAIIERESTHV